MIGIDAVDIERLRGTFDRAPNIERRLFTESERGYCWAKADPLLHFAGTLAAKEAVIKAAGLGTLVAWGRRIEVNRAGNGAPQACIHGIPHRPIHLSISHDGPVAVAVAIATASPARRRPSVGPNKPSEGPNKEGSPDEGKKETEDAAVPRPNAQLLRYIGLGHSDHNPHEPSARKLVEATELPEGTDFP